MIKEIDGPTLRKWIINKDIVLVDARDPKDYLEGHLPGAISLLLKDIERKAEDILEKNVPIVVYSKDANCPASGLVAEKLEKAGLTDIYNYNPSYADWVERGYTVEK